MLQPILALILWTLVLSIWLYATRIPAMRAAKINPDKYKLKGSAPFDILPEKARAVADNYNHLHEAPTIFYALALLIQIGGYNDAITSGLAWVYVLLRVVHSLIQANAGKVMRRFLVFSSSQIVMMLLALYTAYKMLIV